MVDYGMKISDTGVDVLTGTDAQMLFTSKYPVLKAKFYGQIDLSAGGEAEITHSLGYSPAFLVWAKAVGSGTYRFMLPRYFSGSDPVGGGIMGYAYVDTSKLYIYSYGNSNAYYYIFVDPLA